jgi:serine/threonine-protein kinase
MSDEGSVVYRPAASGATRRVVVWVDRNGREEVIPMEARAYQYPRLSPDGQRVALDLREQLNDIWYWDLARSTLTKVTNARRTGGPALWSGDGKAVIFGQNVDGATNVFTQSVDGGPRQRLLTGPTTQLVNDVTPDGRSLVLAEFDRGDGINLRLLHLDGRGEAEDLIRTPYNEQNADVSPDGRWIAYQSDDSGRNEVYVRPFPNAAAGRRQVSVSGGTRPLWSRDGRELFFLDPNRRMTVVDVRTGPSLTFGRPRTLFDTTPLGLEGQQRNFDLAPDGKRFLMVRNLPPPPDVPALVLIQNWLGELRAAAR